MTKPLAPAHKPPPLRHTTAIVLVALVASAALGEEPAPSPLFSPFVRGAVLGNDLRDAAENAYDEVVELVDPPATNGIVISNGDLHTFNVFFDRTRFQSRFRLSSLEWMKQDVWFAAHGENSETTGWRMDAYHGDLSFGFGDEVRGGWLLNDSIVHGVRSDVLRRALAEVKLSAYTTGGIRSMLIQDDFSFYGVGSILGRTGVKTEVDHYVIGPQLGVGAVAEASMFRFEALVLGLAGYSRIDVDQSGVFGEEAIPGALNRSAIARRTASGHDDDNDEFALHGEARLSASCQLTQRWRFDTTWRWIVSDPVQRGYDATAWRAPYFGINEATDVLTDQHWFFGFTYTR